MFKSTINTKKIFSLIISSLSFIVNFQLGYKVCLSIARNACALLITYTCVLTACKCVWHSAYE